MLNLIQKQTAMTEKHSDPQQRYTAMKAGLLLHSFANVLRNVRINPCLDSEREGAQNFG